MKIRIFIGRINENSIFMQFYIILSDKLYYFAASLKCYREIIDDLPVFSHNHKLLANFHSGTLRIMDTMGLKSLFF